ncbi:MAG: NAD(P)-dependent oxidoreductase [Myxococcota bacterium]
MSRERVRVLSHLPVALLARASELVPTAELVHIPADDALPPDVGGEVLLTFTRGAPNLAEVLARGVRWIHTIGTGIDGFPLEHVGERVLTCARGASAVPIAEWVMAMLLSFEKRLPESWIHDPPERWNLATLSCLAGRTLGLIGLGGIGLAVAERARPFGVRMIAHRRSPQPSPHVDIEIVELDTLLEASDHVVVVAPATASTRHLLDARAFARLKPGAHLVNVSRGGLVDQDALRDALDSGRLACASLDVVEPEPLPEGHWLYSHPRVRLSPHISWCMPDAIPRILDSFAENLRRYAAGEPLLGVVDLKRGY